MIQLQLNSDIKIQKSCSMNACFDITCVLKIQMINFFDSLTIEQLAEFFIIPLNHLFRELAQWF